MKPDISKSTWTEPGWEGERKGPSEAFASPHAQGASAFEIVVDDSELTWQAKPTSPHAEVQIDAGRAPGTMKKVFDGEVTAGAPEMEGATDHTWMRHARDGPTGPSDARAQDEPYAEASPLDCAPQIASARWPHAKTA